MTRIVVAYEDAGPARTFGPHVLALACIADLLAYPTHVVATWFEPIPKNGNGPLLDFCRRAAALPGGMPIFALFDEDRLARLIREQRLVGNGSDVQKISALDPRLRVHALARNVETLTRWAATELSLPPPRKTINERDMLLAKLAKPAHQVFRSRLCDEVPTFGAFVQDLCAAAVCRALSRMR